MNEDRIAQVEQAIVAIEAAGRSWTNQTIFGMVGGNYASLSQYLKARRAGTLASGAVAVLEPQTPLPAPPAPPLPPAPAPDSPLGMAKETRDGADAAEQDLAAQHTVLKRQRQQVEERLRVLEMTKSMCPPAADLARKREEKTLRSEHVTIETERLRIFVHLSQANTRRLEAADAYRELQEQAGRWLRRMRQRQREARTMPHAWARGDAADEAQQAAEQLAALIGDEAVAVLAADATLQPDWLRD